MKKTITIDIEYNEQNQMNINMNADTSIRVLDILRVFDSLSETHTSTLEKHVVKNPDLTIMEDVEKLTLKDLEK